MLEDKGYSYFEVGSANYSGGDNDLYISIDEPFSNGYCGLEEKAKELLNFLTENKILYKGTVDVVGGLNIW